MIAHPLYDRFRPAVPYAESLARNAPDERLPARRAVQRDVADDGVLLRGEGRAFGRHDRHLAAGESLAEVVVGVAFQTHRDARREEGPEALPPGAGQVDTDRVLRQAVLAVALGDLVAEHRPQRPVAVADVHREPHGDSVLDGGPAPLDQRVVERRVDAVVLRLFRHEVRRDAVWNLRPVQKGREVEAARLPMVYGSGGVQHVYPPHHLVDRAEAHVRHDLPQLLGHEEEVVDDVFGLPCEFLAKDGILRGDADGAGVQVALAEHDAAHDDERRCREAELLCAEQAGYSHVATGLQLPVRLHDDAAPKVVHHENLLRLRYAELPWEAGVLDRRLRGRARPARIAADEHHVAVPLRYPRGDGSHPCLGHELDVDTGLGVGVLEVVDELGEILDGVDVVVWRRRDKLHARRRVAHPSDVVVDLVAGQLPALAGLRPLRHLDLQVGGVGEIGGRDAKPP